VHAVFSDASKAFDQVLHIKLFEKLIPSANVFCMATETLAQETNHTNKMGHTLSDPFRVTNGVTQGEVLSPYLFAVYLDDFVH